MDSLFVLNDSFTSGYRAGMLDFISLVSILSAILVIVSKNPIVSVLFLIGLFLSISCYLIVLGLNFIGLSYLLVYVGAVSILFLFILMLINVRISELLNETSNSIPLVILIILAFNYPVSKVLPYSVTVFIQEAINKIWYVNYNYTIDNVLTMKAIISDKSEVLYATSKIWDGNMSEFSHITSIGNIMYTSHSIWLIITSIILLLAMVGAIVITIKQKPILNNI
uniref:NADH-ubiquinone oxidoreductase chain 6 n=1 Tax=Antarctomyces pellizariae TaxID=1955577 RepID=A0A6H1UA14_9PEZI|nr:Nad6 [Antarctomyces pellizariae]YP_010943482.1 Nad6 [Antarctomyces psychrotrophicus]QIZ74893.1 Nad6 [Antarctomyces pellizariae]WLS55511.1 Nad6 [Antarctomyces psychrotrophicus]